MNTILIYLEISLKYKIKITTYPNCEDGDTMSNKHKFTNKQMAKLGLKKTDRGDYDYIDPEEKEKSKYRTVKKESQ
ncbi:hypothetical protein [Clostridium sp.]